ncbi:hypothetical protein L1049_013428 [Liquidambar formosana]|uniref:Uncharacterized protein n=1 Tax=Liquidambar formosana TaxID=63359 RepID=A0AAP0WWV2_LIQFO
MEFNENLQSLVERAWALHESISDEINSNSVSFCRLCSEYGRYCGIAETPFEERERLIAIRDSLKDVENKLIFLQRTNSWQLTDRHAALTRLEESRIGLIDKVTQHQGRALDVMTELNSCFGNGKTAFNWNLKDTMEKRVKTSAASNSGKKGILGFVICCFRILISPWKWQKGTGLTVKLVAASASVSSLIHFYRTRQQCSNSQRKVLSFVNSTEAGRGDFQLTISKSPLDVFNGRG